MTRKSLKRIIEFIVTKLTFALSKPLIEAAPNRSSNTILDYVKKHFFSKKLVKFIGFYILKHRLIATKYRISFKGVNNEYS